MAKLKGVFMKSTINSLLSGKTLFPEYKKIVDEMKDDDWYSWDLYTKMLNDISGKLSPIVVKKVGKSIILAGKNVFINEQGYDSLEKLLKAYPQMHEKTIVGLHENEKLKLIKYEEGHMILHHTTRQPKDFNEGVILGYFEMFNKRVRTFSIKQINEHYYEIDVTW
ncbi:hypothetical protein [Clostridium magnum]|uniref:Uncharacterized protein n=1 Tax=Clostridium magnum DSM 2767 TaxID=1121326 RepID=A0A162QUS9_9CLOT|nr:hypothetical protein [Clostridium magnum]KZL88995.1 hypothetical protein CLMAG_56930 [Clostridium magnum DSM 2767]SHI23422.1 hypothetical protein SAMN02745944_03465 [Clostridium magnum DSM 2767]